MNWVFCLSVRIFKSNDPISQIIEKALYLLYLLFKAKEIQTIKLIRVKW